MFWSLVRWRVAGREGPSNDNVVAALPTDVSVYTWLSQTKRFKRAVVTSNVERVMMSQVDMIRYCRAIVRTASRLIAQAGGFRINHRWC
jgi:hypothetical protein